MKRSKRQERNIRTVSVRWPTITDKRSWLRLHRSVVGEHGSDVGWRAVNGLLSCSEWHIEILFLHSYGLRWFRENAEWSYLVRRLVCSFRGTYRCKPAQLKHRPRMRNPVRVQCSVEQGRTVESNGTAGIRAKKNTRLGSVRYTVSHNMTDLFVAPIAILNTGDRTRR